MASHSKKEEDDEAIAYLRCLAMELPTAAKSGHPGAPLGCSPMAYTVFSRHLRCNPKNPHWINRDRFVLSNGHASALLYSLLHLSGYDISLDDLKHFRQVGSITPGHPENHLTPGVETTTGPLGQGFANAVGLAIAQTHLAALFNRPDLPHPLIDNYIYVIMGDGCHQEGITGEAASLAGHLKLGKLVVLYDDNDITIDGPTSLSFTEDVGRRYEAYGWQVLRVANGDDDIEAIDQAIITAKQDLSRPSIILVKTTIGYGSKKQGTHEVHGSPLAVDDIAAIKTKFGLDPTKSFYVPDHVRARFSHVEKGQHLEQAWQSLLDQYAERYPDLIADLRRRLSGQLPQGLIDAIQNIPVDTINNSTRKMSATALNVIAPLLPELIGGSADLTPSTLTSLRCSHDFQAATPDGRYLRFGVREHAMCAIANGLAAYGAVIPFASTFFSFVGYALGAIRLSSLSHLRVIYVMTHDSIGVGEDGPTHQPIETLASLRSLPNHYVWRPANQSEVSAAYIAAISNASAPTTIAFTRQDLEPLPIASVEAALRGGYVVFHNQEDGRPIQATLVATGSEVPLAVKAARQLAGTLSVQVVSLPCWQIFQAQDISYQKQVLPAVPTLSVEAASILGWERFAHAHIGMTTFGASGPPSQLFVHYGFTPENVAAKLQKLLALFGDSPAPSPLGIVSRSLD